MKLQSSLKGGFIMSTSLGTSERTVTEIQPLILFPFWIFSKEALNCFISSHRVKTIFVLEFPPAENKCNHRERYEDKGNKIL